MALIPDDFLRRLLEDTDLVGLVEESVTLKKASGEFAARCPFHEEKSPSFTVSPRKQFYHCFGCGAHGNAIDWLMTHGRLGFREAAESLARRLGRELPRTEETPEQKARRAQRQSALEVLRAADGVFRGKLRASEEAIAYLRDARGISGKTAATFLLGWAPEAYGTLRDSGLDKSALLEAGLLSEGEDGRVYDRFRGRLMFPIRDAAGRIVGYGGRLLGDGKPKYLNSPETATFQKGRLLYGLHEYVTDRERSSPLLVVEGYMDVVQLAEHGVSAVATLGTSVTSDQVALAFRHTDSLMFVFDGDAAGQRAAWRALEAVLPHMDGKRRVSFVALPAGKDPDDMARELGGEAMLAWLQEHAESVSGFLIKRLPERLSTTHQTPEGKAQLAQEAGPLIACAPADVYRDALIEAIHKAWGVPSKTLRKLISDAEGGSRGRSTGTTSARPAGEASQGAYTPGWRSAWEDSFALSKEGNVKASLHNVILILENHPLWADMFAMNEFANEIVIQRPPPWSSRTGQLEESDGTELAAWIGDPMNYGVTVTSSMVLESIEAVAKRRRFHPVLEYLDRIEWDGVKRLPTMFADFFGARQDEYTETVGCNWLTSAVARVRNPGCKVDFMIILEGEQGRGKSTAVRTLCGPEWFAEMMESPQNKDFYQLLTGRWIVEIPELQAFNKSDRNKIKAAISAQEDTYRPSYGRYARQFPRQCIFVGTTNDDAYLKDETGARRFLPVRCGEVALDSLASVRDQLWAEADARYLAGETFWEFPESAAAEQDARYDADAWEEPISRWLDGRAEPEAYPTHYPPAYEGRPVQETTISDVMAHALRIEVAKHSRPDQMRVGAILRRLNWRREQKRMEGRRIYVYCRPSEP